MPRSETRRPNDADWWEPALDGLRAIACLMVIVHHTQGSWFEDVALANAGVALFFCLSGFLIFVVAVREYERTGTISIRRFYRRRILRIWPLYFFIVAVGLGVNLAPGILVEAEAFRSLSTGEYLLGHGYAFPLFVSNLFLAFSFIGDHRWFAPAFLAVTWSIAVEEQFYACFPFVFRRVMRPGFPKLRFVVGAVAVGLVARTAFVALPVALAEALVIPSDSGLYYFSLSYIDMFVLGAAAGYVHVHRRGLGQGRPHAMTVLFVTALLSTFALTVWWTPSLWPPYRWYSPLIYTLLAVAISCLIYSIVANPGGRYATLLSTRPLRILGFLSYAMYLAHVPVLLLIHWHLRGMRPAYELPETVHAILGLLYVLAAIVATAVVLHLVIERPFLLLRRGHRPTESRAAVMTTSTFPWWHCLTVAVAIIVAFELVYWRSP
jgi:peptidoglycan/LPS O-acetylase OafA/YrhL